MKSPAERGRLKIHLISSLFHPDELGGAALYTDLAHYFKERGHDIRVTTTFPYYPAWRLRPKDRGRRVVLDEVHSIPVKRIAMHVPERPTAAGRIRAELSFFASLLRRAQFDGWIPDVVVTASPMLSQCLAQRFLYRGRRVPRFIIVHDFVVDAALGLKMVNLPVVTPVLRAIERWGLRSAASLATISVPMLERLTAVVGGDRKLMYIPNWIHRSLARRTAVAVREHRPREQRLLFYSGNVGVKQGLPAFLRDFPDPCEGWMLAINGGGAEIEDLQRVAASRGNVIVGGLLEEGAYLEALYASSACLITQQAGVGASFLPSKLLPALATGTPVLAVCDEASPLGQEVRAGGFGEVVPPGDPQALRGTLMAWNRDPGLLAELSRRSAQRATHYSREAVLPQFEAELVRLAGRVSAAGVSDEVATSSS